MRRDEWIAAGVFDQLRDRATRAFDPIIGLDQTDVAIDGNFHDAPNGARASARTPPTGG